MGRLVGRLVSRVVGRVVGRVGGQGRASLLLQPLVSMGVITR